MESKELKFSQKIDLNVAINGGAVDVGVIYEVPHFYADTISVSAAGIVTPLKEGGAFVVVKNASTGEDIDKIVLKIEPDITSSLVIAIVPVAPPAPSFTVAYAANHLDYTATWANLITPTAPDATHTVLVGLTDYLYQPDGTTLLGTGYLGVYSANGSGAQSTAATIHKLNYIWQNTAANSFAYIDSGLSWTGTP